MALLEAMCFRSWKGSRLCHQGCTASPQEVARLLASPNAQSSNCRVDVAVGCQLALVRHQMQNNYEPFDLLYY